MAPRWVRLRVVAWQLSAGFVGCQWCRNRRLWGVEAVRNDGGRRAWFALCPGCDGAGHLADRIEEVLYPGA